MSLPLVQPKEDGEKSHCRHRIVCVAVPCKGDFDHVLSIDTWCEPAANLDPSVDIATPRRCHMFRRHSGTRILSYILQKADNGGIVGSILLIEIETCEGVH